MDNIVRNKMFNKLAINQFDSNYVGNLLILRPVNLRNATFVKKKQNKKTIKRLNK